MELETIMQHRAEIQMAVVLYLITMMRTLVWINAMCWALLTGKLNIGPELDQHEKLGARPFI